MNKNEEKDTEIPEQTELEKELDKKSKPNVLVTLLKVAVYIISYVLMNIIWLAVLVLVTFSQYRPDFGNEWGLFLQDKNKLMEFTVAIIKRTYMLNWYVLAGGVTWLLLLFIFYRVRKQPVLERTGLKKCPPAFLLVGLLTGIGCKLLIDGIYSFIPQLAGGETAGAVFKDLYLSDPNTGLSAVLSTLALVVITPVAEEIIFRGICFGHLKKIWPIPVTVAVTSVIFGLMHPSSKINLLFMVLWSVLLCLMVYWSGSVIPSVLSHMVFNLIAMFRLLNGIKFRTDTGVWLLISGIPFLIAGVILLLRLRPSGQITVQDLH